MLLGALLDSLFRLANDFAHHVVAVSGRESEVEARLDLQPVADDDDLLHV